MLVNQIMSKPVETISPDATAVDAAKRLREKRIGSLVVEMDTPVGIVTETDIIDLVAEGKDVNDITVSEFMSSPLITIEGFEPVGEASERMRENNIRKLPVIYGGALAGIITTTDISYHMPRIMEGEDGD